MKKAEILTLLSAGVDEKTIITAEAAGHMETILRRAYGKVADAQHFSGAAKWVELFKVMEGTVADAATEWRADRENRAMRKDAIDRY